MTNGKNNREKAWRIWGSVMALSVALSAIPAPAAVLAQEILEQEILMEEQMIPQEQEAAELMPEEEVTIEESGMVSEESSETDISENASLEEEIEIQVESQEVVDTVEMASGTLEGNGTAASPYLIKTAEDFDIAAGMIGNGGIFALTTNITLTSGQQIASLAGTLDGKGHTITLAGKPLANNVTGIIQNLGVTSSGTIDANACMGSIAVTLSGTIQNCWSTANLSNHSFEYFGGLVGQLNGGTISHSYFAGTLSGLFGYGGLVGDPNTANNTSNQVKYSYYTCGDRNNWYGSFEKGTVTNVSLKTCEQMNQDVDNLLNTDRPNTGYKWDAGKDGNGPVLVHDSSAPAEVNKDALEALLEKANVRMESNYSALGDEWKNFVSARTSAAGLMKNDAATQAAVNEAVNTLNTAMEALNSCWITPTKAVPVPEAADPVEISSANDLTKLEGAEIETYYVLTSDITLPADFAAMDSFGGILDGKGHTITFEGDSSLFTSVSKTGVLQNICFKGNVGAVAEKLDGAIVNSSISSGSFAGKLGESGVATIAGCLSTSAEENSIFKTLVNGGAIVNTYWLEGTSGVGSTGTAGGNNSAVAADQMKTTEFIDRLNGNRGDYGSVWAQGLDGNPYFGEDMSDVYDVIHKIETLPETAPTEEVNQAIKAAEDALAALDSERKELVSSELQTKLTEARTAYNTAKKAAADAAAKKAADEAAVKKVTDLINALPQVKLDETVKAAIDQARAAYTALTEDQKKLVSAETLKKLTDAEAAYETLKKADEAANTVVPSITLNCRTLPLQVKQSTTGIEIKTAAVDGDKITSAKSSNKKIATVKVKNGKLTVTGKKKGSATVTVTAESGAAATVKIKVRKKAVALKKLIAVTEKQITVKKGSKATLKVAKQPFTAKDKVTWSSSDKKVATVTSAGVVKGVKKGSATITAKAGSKTVKFKVKVN